MKFQSQCDCAMCSILPPYIVKHMRTSGDERLERIAETMQDIMQRLRERRQERFSAIAPQILAPSPTPLERTIFDCGKTNQLPGRRVFGEGESLPADPAAKEAYTYCGVTWKFYRDVFKRYSVDNRGLPLKSSVHYQEGPNGLDNAFWDGSQMIYGDGDAIVFGRFTQSLDVIGHELTHGVTQNTAALAYAGQSGALNEHFSDVFGILVRQWQGAANGDAHQSDPGSADWIIGKELFLPGVKGVGLRSMSNPGSAYDDPRIGKDPQPKHMSGYVQLENTPDQDNGGVHFNSGIPNYAFYLAAKAIGGPAWETTGSIWYITLTERLRADADFAKCATETISVARDHYGDAIAQKVAAAWASVGVQDVKPPALAALIKQGVQNLQPALALADAAIAQARDAAEPVKRTVRAAKADIAAKKTKGRKKPPSAVHSL
jgi:Zn-dependent metalloprotease